MQQCEGANNINWECETKKKEEEEEVNTEGLNSLKQYKIITKNP